MPKAIAIPALFLALILAGCAGSVADPSSTAVMEMDTAAPGSMAVVTAVPTVITAIAISPAELPLDPATPTAIAGTATSDPAVEAVDLPASPTPTIAAAAPTATATVVPDDGLTEEQRWLLDSLPSQGEAPELHNEVWLNSDPLALADLRGQVVLLDMWTYG